MVPRLTFEEARNLSARIEFNRIVICHAQEILFSIGRVYWRFSNPMFEEFQPPLSIIKGLDSLANDQ